MVYEIHDSHGAPQCGVEIVRFETWAEVEEYLDAHPDVSERVAEMQAVIVSNAG